jgi:hypothetical protein
LRNGSGTLSGKDLTTLGSWDRPKLPEGAIADEWHPRLYLPPEKPTDYFPACFSDLLDCSVNRYASKL